MKLFELRRQWKSEFQALNIDTCDVDFIISEVLSVSRTDLALISEITDEQKKILDSKIALRKKHIPVDKIFSHAYFYNLEFKVDENVLTPRQDSEIVVDSALDYIQKFGYTKVLDMCTGSGCLSIAISKNSKVSMTAVDVSSKALKIAQFNAKANGVDIKFIQSDMFKNVHDTFDLVVTNPPYIASRVVDTLDVEVREHDPRLALDGGDSGLDYYRIIENDIHKVLRKNGVLIMEIGDDQLDSVTQIFKKYELLETKKDLGGNDRVMIYRIK